MDIRRGIGMFTPKPERPVSFVALKETLKNAGYTLEAAFINVTGTLTLDDEAAFLNVSASGQRFALADINWHQAFAGLTSGSSIEIIGDWKTVVGGTNNDEVIVVRRARKFGDPTVPKVAILVHPFLLF